MENAGLVLEGGGMRGVYTAGVLEFFMEKDIYFPYCIGVSSGACQAASYLSRQKGRNKQINIDFIKHPKYISYKNLFLKQELFGMDFLFDELPNQLVPFDFATFSSNADQFIIVATDCETGEPVYFEKEKHENDIFTLIRASSSLPLMAPTVQYNGQHLLDGGISDPIPIRKAQANCEKVVIILTRNPGHRKTPFKFIRLLQKRYPQYPKLIQAIINRYKLYNETMDYIEEQARQNKIYIIRPEQKLQVKRVERNQQKLLQLYEQGMRDAENHFEKLTDWLHK